MRLKTFQAPTMAEAMRLVRQQLGEDAIIVATHEENTRSGVRVTAALEDEDPDFSPGRKAPETLDVVDVVCDALDYHGLPAVQAERLLNIAAQFAAGDAVLALAGALDACFTFEPLPERAGRAPIMFVGPPGSGKTVSLAKLAMRAALAGNAATIVTTDTVRAGAVEQIRTYGRRMGVPVREAADVSALLAAVARAPSDHLVLIDTLGANPYSGGDMERLTASVKATSPDVVLVMTAGRDPGEAGDLARAFVPLSPRRLLVTCLDMSHRLGGALTAAAAAQLAFCDVSLSPELADGLKPLNPVSLARLLLPEAAHAASATRTGQFKATGSR